MLTTTQLNTGYSGALVYRQMIGRLRTPARDSEPALHGPVPTGSTGLSLFRFEGATLGSSRPRLPPCRVELLELLGMRPGRRLTAHPVRAPVVVPAVSPLRHLSAWRPDPGVRRSAP